MAHEVETMAFANEVPWHGLGTQVDDSLTPDEFLVAAGLDWEVEKRPMFIDAGDGERLEVDGKKALVRTSDNKIMSVVSDKCWHPVQNRDLLAFMDDYVRAGGATLETAGSLRGGKIIWGLAKLKHGFDVTPGDRVEGYLLIKGSHQVGFATSVDTTTIRVVCANTMRLAASNCEIAYKQTHLSEFDFDAAKLAVGEAHESLRRAEASAKTLAGLKLSAEDAVAKVLAPVFVPSAFEDGELVDAEKVEKSRVIPKLLESLTDAPGAAPGTAWGVLNAVTHYSDHVSGNSPDTRLASAWIGEASRRKLDVESKLLELAA